MNESNKLKLVCLLNDFENIYIYNWEKSRPLSLNGHSKNATAVYGLNSKSF